MSSRGAGAPRSGDERGRVLLGAEARAALRAGVDAVTDALKVTLGPSGRYGVLGKKFNGGTTVTNDGVTVARQITLPDPFQNQGAKLIRSVAARTDFKAGDGTTTTAVVAQAMIAGGNRSIVAGVPPVAIRRGIDLATEQVLEYLSSESTPVTIPEGTTRIAAISSGDILIGDAVADALQKVGPDGHVKIEDGTGLGMVVKHTPGLHWEQGYLSPRMATDPETMDAVLENPYLLFADLPLSSAEELLPLLERVRVSGRPLLIVARKIEEGALAILIENKLKGNLDVVGIRAPDFVLRRRRRLEDGALMTGGLCLSPETGIDLRNVQLEHLGEAGRVVVDQRSTVVVEPRGDKQEIEQRVAKLRLRIEEASYDTYERDQVINRIARLTGGIAIVEVGAGTEAELGERRQRVEDALNAAREAVSEGILPGGGTSLVAAERAIEVDSLDDDERVGAELVRSALSAPLRQIAANAGYDGSVITAKVRAAPAGHGFDASTGEITDLAAAGVIDPASVVKMTIAGAASIAKTVLLAEAVVIDGPGADVQETRE